MQTDRPSDLVQTTFRLLAIGALIAMSLWIVRPFLAASAWATTIVVATWPLLLRVERWLGGRRSPAVAVMTIALLLVLVVPLYLGVTAIVGNAKRIADWSQSLTTFTLPPLPAWVGSLPVVGTKLAARWQALEAERLEELLARLAPYGQNLVGWFVGQVGGIGLLFFQFLLTVIIAAIMYANGETVAHGVTRFARRLAGSQGETAVHLAGQAIRGVALGVIVTAVLQSTAAGIGIAIAGVPFATILTAVMFVLSVAQLGPLLVLVPAVIWVYWTRGEVWGTLLLIWAIFCGTFDNILRPALIKRGADLPLLLIFTGVIGGLIAFGVIGLFVGPVVLAVAYTLLVDWVSERGPSAEPGPSPPALGD